MIAARSIEIPLRIYIEDTDAGGIVYYVNYLKFMERARSEFLRALGCGKAALLADELMFVVSSVAVDYRAAAQLDDELSVSATVKKVGKVALVFEQVVRRGEQVLCCGEIKVACVSRDQHRPTAIPATLLQQLQ